MYQRRVKHVLSPLSPRLPDDVDQAMWELFKAISDFWQLDADPDEYRVRLRSFMADRISLNPAYAEFYGLAKRLIDRLIARDGLPKAYESLFTNKPRHAPTAPPETELEFVQVYVANELIAWRIALGGFKAFGAINYRGYFGGANIDGQPIPYRPKG
ncbi:hypothetical protein AC629_24280 [Bradyrhizobium sp. NAS80.1]|nr:hypothetical protein AC629_24280 [Bradyrhizobium sp. NAS80.1]